MILSALLLSVGINFSLCVLFFTLYSILRKQPKNFDVYVPRLLAEGKLKQTGHFNLERLLPSAGWVRSAWTPSEDELSSSAGLDVIVFMRIFIFSLKVFAVTGAIGLFVLLPLNCMGNQLKDVDFTDLSNNSLDLFSISNVNDGSSRLWIHFCAVYLVTGWVCFLLYFEYKYISLKRIEYFYSSEPQPHQFTILVRSIPTSGTDSVSDTVEKFFSENYPSTYVSHVVVRRTNKLRTLMRHAEKMYTEIVNLRSETRQNKFKRDGFLGLLGNKVDIVDHYAKKLEHIEEDLRLRQSETSLLEDEARAAFVSFKSRYVAAVAFHMNQSMNPTEWVIEQAPEPHDVYWPFFSSSFIERWIYKMVVMVFCTLITILFLIPVVFVQGLTNLSQLQVWFPFLKRVLKVAFVSQVITGYIPSVILQLFLKLVPPMMEFLSSIQGYISHSQIEKSACNKVVWFTIWNAFFAIVLSGSVLNQIAIFLDPKYIPTRLAVAVPAQASFFIAYVVTSGWTSTASEIFRVIPFIWSILRTRCGHAAYDDDDDLEVPSFPYHKDIPRVLFFVLLGITYFFLSPLILPFLLVYFCLGYIIFRHQFLNVYTAKYESGGRLWPIVHNSVIFSLLLMHSIAVGIFWLKQIHAASISVIPLPLATLLFNEYCRKRFLPIFTSYSVQSLRKKDGEDENINEFFETLSTAYKDPALLPTNYSINSQHRRPLLSPLPQ